MAVPARLWFRSFIGRRETMTDLHATVGQQNHWSGMKGIDGGTRFSAAPMGAVLRGKEKLVYIGLGTVVVIIVIVAVVMMLRRR
jgi:hypothetical protein